METSKRLDKLIEQISAIYIESRNKQTLEKRLENYTQANLLITEANKLINDIQNFVVTLDMNKEDNSHIGKINEFIDMLSNNHLNFNETLSIVNQLMIISSGLPSDTQIQDNIQQEVIYEEI